MKSNDIKITDLSTGITYIDFVEGEVGIYTGTPGYNDADFTIDLESCKIEITN